MPKGLTARRVVPKYLFALAVPTLALVYFGLNALTTQRQAIDKLSLANDRLLAARIADQIERAATQLASACLDDPAVHKIVDTTRWAIPEDANNARRGLRRLLALHPIARDVIVVGDGFDSPSLDESLRLSDRDYLAQTGTDEGSISVIEKADRLESAGDSRAAMTLYTDLAKAGRSPRASALAQSRAAILQERAGETRAARATWQRIGSTLADTYDATGRPFGLVSAIEVQRLGGNRPDVETTTAAVRDLSAGRWSLTEAQARYFAAALDPSSASRFDDWPLAHQFRAARLLRENIQRGPMPQPGVTVATSGRNGAVDEQFFYTALQGGSRFLAIAVDLTWARHALLDIARRDLGDDASAPGQTVSVVDATPGTTALRTSFPFWGVGVGPNKAPNDRTSLAFAAGILGVIGLLIISVVFIYRDAARDVAVARLRSDLVNGVSHELKTPLSVVRLYAETLADDPDAPKEQRRNYYNVIVHESDRLSHLITRVLDFASDERGLQHYALAPVLLSDVVATVIDRYRPYLSHLGFDVTLDVSERTEPINADSEAVMQTVITLIDNATKYSGDSRLVAVNVRQIDGEAVVEVVDRGIGLTPQERSRIFDPFYRSPRSRHRGGYGLGLHLVRRVMSGHGGRIEVDSEPGQGSTFRLVFPLARGAA